VDGVESTEMIGMEAHAPALGGEERSDEVPGAEAASAGCAAAIAGRQAALP